MLLPSFTPAQQRNREVSFIFSSLQTLLKSAQILPGKFAMNFHEELIDARKTAANYRALWKITQKIRPFQTIGATKMRWTIAICRGNIVWSEISLKSPEKPGILTKFVCVTFAQYCTDSSFSNILHHTGEAQNCSSVALWHARLCFHVQIEPPLLSLAGVSTYRAYRFSWPFTILLSSWIRR